MDVIVLLVRTILMKGEETQMFLCQHSNLLTAAYLV